MSKRTSGTSDGHSAGNGASNGNAGRHTKLNDDARQRDQIALAKLNQSSEFGGASAKTLKSVSGSSKSKRFHIPEKEITPGEYTPGKKNPIHSILTALPILMLFAGLFFFYRGESEQTSGAPIVAESVEVQGTFTGLSELKSGSEGQHFLWLTDATGRRGIRIQASEVALFADRERGLPISVDMAPTVSGSSTFWAWRVTLNDDLVLEREIAHDGR